MKHLLEALNSMLADQGLPRVTELPDLGFKPEVLASAESALASLTAEEREELCVGDQENWSPIFQKLGDKAEITHMVLDELFGNIF